MQHNQVGIQRLPSANSPVDMLPNEIFVEILRVTAASLELDGMTWLTLAMAVCRRWRGIIVHTPILWTDIDLTKNWRFVDLCLAYSDGMNIMCTCLNNLLMSRRSRLTFRLPSPSSPHIVGEYLV